jgi:transglutaminase-like putative cysteine protease
MVVTMASDRRAASWRRLRAVDDRYLRATALLDVGDPRLQALVEQRCWRELPERARIGAIYDFVRDEVPFGYNASDDMPGSAVLADGYGQCNTKTILLMALLRASGIGCRFHGATIDKRLQHGVMAGLLYRLAPSSIIHSWAEVFVDGRWVGLEGVILDHAYLEGIRARTGQDGGAFLGYGVGTDDLANPPIEWTGTDTRIQATGLNQDFGVFDDPDAFYLAHGVNARGTKGWLYRRLMRNAMNKRVTLIRSAGAADE